MGVAPGIREAVRDQLTGGCDLAMLLCPVMGRGAFSHQSREGTPMVPTPDSAANPPGSSISFEPASTYFDGEEWKHRTNCSSLKELDKSPVAYQRRYIAGTAPIQDHPAFAYGTLLHKWGELLDGLDGDPFWDRAKIAPAQCVTATGQFGKLSAEWLASLAAEDIPVSPSDYTKLNDQTEQILANRAAAEILANATHKEFNIKFQIGDHDCKCRVDLATESGFADFKSTRDAAPDETFQYAVRDFKYDLQAAFYLYGGMAAGWPRHTMKFIATSTTYPYHCAVMTLPPIALREAELRILALIKELEKRRALDWWTPSHYGQVIEMPARFFTPRKAW